MKKKSIKSLKLNKKMISRVTDLKGGVENGSLTVTIAPITLTCVISACGIINITRGDCDMPTIGHDDGSICISDDPDAWCGGR